MGKNLKSFRIIFNILILLITAVLLTYNMFAWYSGSEKSDINDIGLSVIDNAKGNSFILNDGNYTSDQEIPLKPGEYTVLNYEFSYTVAKKLLIYLRPEGLSFLDTEGTGDNEILAFGRKASDVKKVKDYYGPKVDTLERLNLSSGMKFTQINTNTDGTKQMSYINDFLDGYTGADSESDPVLISKMDKLVNSANVYDALEVSAIMLTDEEYTALGTTKKSEIFSLSRKSSKTLTYFENNPAEYVFDETIPVSPTYTPSEGSAPLLAPTHVLFVYYYNPYVFPSIYSVTDTETTYYTKDEFDLLATTPTSYTEYIASSSTLYMYEHPIVQIEFKY